MTALPSPHLTFADLSPTPGEHFRLAFFAAVSQVLSQVAQTCGSLDTALERFPFLAGYADEIALRGLNVLPDSAWWTKALDGFEARATEHLPLRTLCHEAGLEPAELSLWMAVGLLEEDPRFGLLFEAMQVAAGHRPTVGLLTAWWQGLLEDPRRSLQRLNQLGLVERTNPDAPRLEWALEIPAALWDALRRERPVLQEAALRYSPRAELTDLVWPPELQATLDKLPHLLAQGQIKTLVLRGPAHNGRTTLLCSLAQHLGRGLLEVRSLERWSIAGPLATALQALPVLRLELAPNETAMVPALSAYSGPKAIVLGPQGGLEGPGLEQVLSLNLELPTPAERRILWQRGLGAELPLEAPRLSRGHIARAADALQVQQVLHQDGDFARHLRQATQLLTRQALDGLATALPTEGNWNHLVVGSNTALELQLLERRIRLREGLPELLGQTPHAPGVGVRALFAGPSGTGKTLAARLLAGALGKDLYRLDLSGVVNKYIGETEKNLEKIFSRAEELDVLLLLDEGDALLTGRTGVQNANDRYANLETNYLLQRLESFSGVLLITTNAAERIDSAFQRRMDVVVEFRAPEAPERLSIWRLHLPQNHCVAGEWLERAAQRCALSGGQIRNAALHATLLALETAQPLDEAHLSAALVREYHKLGQVCPL